MWRGSQFPKMQSLEMRFVDPKFVLVVSIQKKVFRLCFLLEAGLPKMYLRP